MARRDCRPGFSDGRADHQARGRSTRATRRDTAGRRCQRARGRRGSHAAARHAVGGARHRGEPERNRDASVGAAQLGRHAVSRPRRAGLPVHRGVGRDVGRQDRRHQRAWAPLAAEQLPARRRRQQQHLDERAGAVDPALASIHRRHWRIQSGDDPVYGRVRPRSRRDDLGDDQVRQQLAAGHHLLLLPRRGIRREHLLLESLRLAEADQQSKSVRRQPRWTAPQGHGLLLRRLRGHADHARRAAHRHRADGRSAQWRVQLRDSRSADRTDVREQHDSRVPHRSGGCGDSRDGADAQRRRKQQFHPPTRHHRRQRPLLGPLRSARIIERQPLRALQLQQTVPLCARLVWRPARRQLDLGLGTQRSELAERGRGVDEDSRPLCRQRIPVRVVARALGRLPGSQG